MAKPFEYNVKNPSFRVSQKAYKFYKSFTRKKNDTQVDTCGLFDKYTNIYTLCATIGRLIGEKTPLTDRVETPFTLEQIDDKTEWPTLISIAWADSNKDMSIFNDSKKIINICDEYAETGINFLLEQYPFSQIYVDDCLFNADKIDLEFQAMLLVKQLKEEFSNAIA